MVREGFQKVSKIPTGSLIWFKGVVRGNELRVDDIAVITSPVREIGFTYLGRPINPLEYAEKYYWFLRGTSYFRKVAEIRHYLLKYAREFLESKGFIEIEAPIVGVVSDPGLRGARKLITTAYGFKLELMSSVIMYKQLMASVFEKIFYVARNIREEPVENAYSGRHLFEFTQLDIEWGLSSMEDVMRLAEELIYYVYQRLASEKPWLLSKDLVEDVLKPPYPVITYDEAIRKARELGFDEKLGSELSNNAESALSRISSKPFWIIMFPRKSRGFYYYPVEGREDYNMDFNLILPGGYGEVLDGGCREYRYPQLVERIKSHGEDLDKYKWFLELSLYGGIAPSCGWGLGVERFIRYLLGVEHVALASLHPRLPGILPV
ncbi:asparagine synthetase A [Thermogladius sp. 4427co]|uniref:asparagine synthetase A n=1 Tax=Thermogladius sp. 4427co TaxID=3450718 RepID=UPI003F7995AA